MIRLFLADDMPAVREVMRTCLAVAPDRYQVIGEAGDGPAALACIVELVPDVIILDVDMPGMNGVEVVRALRSQGIDRPVILCSSWESAAHSDLPVGITHCLQKPFRFESLTAAVDSAAAIGLHHD
ncbi:MAG TPA: response regulator transcription factor [Symbiobacteriaceae bacterium]|nr:response regulator transcription factor [Symbiobacteriaceae bacterium]